MPKIKTTAPIHDTLTGYDFKIDKPLRPLRAIRVKCAECCNGNIAEVRRCEMKDCSLWPWRFGKRPAGASTPHERAELATDGGNIESDSDDAAEIANTHAKKGAK